MSNYHIKRDLYTVPKSLLLENTEGFPPSFIFRNLHIIKDLPYSYPPSGRTAFHHGSLSSSTDVFQPAKPLTKPSIPYSLSSNVTTQVLI